MVFGDFLCFDGFLVLLKVEVRHNVRTMHLKSTTWVNHFG